MITDPTLGLIELTPNRKVKESLGNSLVFLQLTEGVPY